MIKHKFYAIAPSVRTEVRHGEKIKVPFDELLVSDFQDRLSALRDLQSQAKAIGSHIKIFNSFG